jgi:L-ascorbate metabolism protein UlaG (beta-lactamase superfamily)
MKLTPAARKDGRFLNPVETKLAGISVVFKVAPRLLFGAAARTPKSALELPRTDPTIYASEPSSGLRVTWFGHSSSLLEIDGVRILIDPVWEERASPLSWSGPKRFFPPTLALEDLPPLDAILISHDHYDHLGAETLRRLAHMQKQRQARWIAPLGIGEILSGLGVAPAQCTELNWTDPTQIGPVTATALPARHFSGRSLFNRFETLWASFVLAGPKHNVYYGADSGEWDGFRTIGEELGPFDLTMLEIGAFDPLWAAIHLGPDGALRAFRALGGQGLFMPIHWGLLDLALHAWDQPIERVSAEPDLKLWSPTPGVPSEVVRDHEIRSAWWR